MAVKIGEKSAKSEKKFALKTLEEFL